MNECGLYSEPELYDLIFSGSDEARRNRLQASEQFYLEEARRAGGEVLELGCGTGRLTIPLAQAGIRITGVDLSSSMLERVREKAVKTNVRIEFVQADMRSFDLARQFAAVLIPGNSLLHLATIADLKQCLAQVRRHLAPAGCLIFDISKWDLSALARDPSERHAVLQVRDPERGEIVVEETSSYDAVRQVRHIVWYFSAPDAPDFRVIDYHLRVIFPQELTLLLDACGFSLEERYGEFPRQPFTSMSPRQVCIARLSDP